MYDAFAGSYDRLMEDYDYAAWADYIAARVTGREGLDIACGTGNITIPLAKKGFRMAGADNSEKMLAAASEKAKRQGLDILFVLQDFCRLDFPKKFDFALVVCDGINYTVNAGTVFNSCAKVLKKGGVLLFDISTEYKLKSIVDSNTFFIDRGDVSCVWQNFRRGGRVDAHLSIFERSGGVYSRRDEEQTMYIHKKEDIESALKSSGFLLTEVLGDGFLPPSQKSQRLYFKAELL